MRLQYTKGTRSPEGLSQDSHFECFRGGGGGGGGGGGASDGFPLV
jgi:hypothetical protein